MIISKKFVRYIPLLILFLGYVALYLLGIKLDSQIYLFSIVGFVAQAIDGSLGMGFGTISTSAMLAFGIVPNLISSGVNAARVFTSAASGINHKINGNINKKLFLSLLIPGIIGAVMGVILLLFLSRFNNNVLRVVISIYTALLGIKIVFRFIKMVRKDGVQCEIKKHNIRPLAIMGGFLSSFAGLGWGTVVTSSLVHRGYTPKYVVGSVNAAAVFVMLVSSITLFAALGVSHWQIILGLIFGGVAAAPLAAKITNKMPSNILSLLVGILVVTLSIFSIAKVIIH